MRYIFWNRGIGAVFYEQQCVVAIIACNIHACDGRSRGYGYGVSTEKTFVMNKDDNQHHS
jgi:hypothetical protein